MHQQQQQQQQQQPTLVINDQNSSICKKPLINFQSLIQSYVTPTFLSKSKSKVCVTSAVTCDCKWANERLCNNYKKIDKTPCNAICCCKVMIDTTIRNDFLQQQNRLRCTSNIKEDGKKFITKQLKRTSSKGCSCDWVQFSHCHPILNDGSPCWRACCTMLQKQQFLLKVEQIFLRDHGDDDDDDDDDDIHRISFQKTNLIPPWKDKKQRQREKFVFQDVDDLLPNHFGSTHTRMPLKKTLCRDGLLQTLCLKTTVLKCISCLMGWYLILDKKGRYSHDVISMNNDKNEIELYESISSLPSISKIKIDIGVPWGCSMNKLITFLKHLPDDIQHDTRLLITNFQDCGYSNDNDHTHRSREKRLAPNIEDVSKIIRTYANRKLKHYKVINVNGIFQRSIGCNVLHKHSRMDSILTVLDVDMRVQTLYFQRSISFVTSELSIYFPIVWSTFNPKNVKLVAKFRSEDEKNMLNVVGSTQGGKWRVWGAGNYAISGKDAKMILLNEHFKGWGGEDIDFLSKSSIKLNVIRARDPYIVHTWHSKDCTTIKGPMKLSCIGSMAEYEGSALSLVLDRK